MDQALCSAMWGPREETDLSFALKGLLTWGTDSKVCTALMYAGHYSGPRGAANSTQGSGSLQARPGQRGLGRISEGTSPGTDISKIKERF